ncbi:hypothetical protein CDAR_573481 [Caerostris darwini]|uniref:Uncharacterized protein n=1 Tax=Caerostris darwini TaxID=1538125 RepID=A0AAV4TDU7_9ARAC|nr:hypothetical protein CDAR_573481 [Caerostris darwini]
MSWGRNDYFLSAPSAYHQKKVSVKRSLEALVAKTSEKEVTCVDSKMAFPARLICIESGIITEKRPEKEESGRINKKRIKSSPRTSFHNSERESRFCRMAD